MQNAHHYVLQVFLEQYPKPSLGWRLMASVTGSVKRAGSGCKTALNFFTGGRLASLSGKKNWGFVSLRLSGQDVAKIKKYVLSLDRAGSESHPSECQLPEDERNSPGDKTSLKTGLDSEFYSSHDCLFEFFVGDGTAPGNGPSNPSPPRNRTRWAQVVNQRAYNQASERRSCTGTFSNATWKL